MKELSNTEGKLKKSVGYEKSVFYTVRKPNVCGKLW